MWKLAVAGASAAAAATLVVLFYVGGGAGEGPPEAHVAIPVKASRPGCEEDGSCYMPEVLEVGAGSTVVWVNEDSAFHSVTSGSYGNQTALFDSGYMDPYELFSYEFAEVGTYPYYCTLHPWMEGAVVVSDSLRVEN